MVKNSQKDTKSRPGNPYGHYRKQPIPTVEQFAEFFEAKGGVPVLKRFLEGANATAEWVHVYFPPIELEVHQAATIGQAVRHDKKAPDYEAVKKQCPRLAICATDAELKEIVESPYPKAKDLTAEIFKRLLQRSKESIKKWAQRKK